LLPIAAVTLRDLPRIRRSLVPRPVEAFNCPDGLCGLAGRIGLAELLEGYRRGMFVMSHAGPLKWWAPRYRMVLFFDQAHVEKTTRKLLRAQRFSITFDSAFQDVMRACAAPRPGAPPLTWITPRVQSLFRQAHDQGYAHSIEVWDDGILVGGVYGLAIGSVFFTESQFHIARDASKVAFAVLNRHLQAWGFAFNDGKHPTRYLASCGMTPVTRMEFSSLTQRFCDRQAAASWRIDPTLLDDRWEPAAAGGTTMQELLAQGSECPWSIEDLLTSQRSCTW
jgi:leucyl/phenylalanyl-tRNA--protein transferase